MGEVPMVKHTFTVLLPNSKSFLIRKLIIGFLYQNKIFDIDNNETDDVKIVHQNLLLISQKQSVNTQQPTIIAVKDCGAAFRFLLSILAITEGNWLLTGSKRLLSRPISPLINALQSVGAEISVTKQGLFVKGKKIVAKHIEIEGGVSSQWISSLLLIAEKIQLKKIIVSSPITSLSYILLTCNMLRINGLNIRRKDNIFYIKKEKERVIHINYIEKDWSSASYWYAVATLFPQYNFFFPALTLSDLQGDTIIAKWYQKFGIISQQKADGIVINHKKKVLPTHLEFNFSSNPDLAIILGVLAVLLPFNVTLSGLQSLNYKESERLTLLHDLLSQFVPTHIYQEEALIVEGTQRILQFENNTIFDSYNDHRLAIALSLFSFFHSITIKNKNCVSKSYPNFWQELKNFRRFVDKSSKVNVAFID